MKAIVSEVRALIDREGIGQEFLVKDLRRRMGQEMMRSARASAAIILT